MTSPPPQAQTHPADASWESIAVEWGVQPSSGDRPAVGPVSPEIVAPTTGEFGLSDLADGFYDLTVMRVGDPPGVLLMDVRQWVPCAALPGRCVFDAPAAGVVADPSTSTTFAVFMDDSLEVIIRTIGEPGAAPLGVSGTGWDFYELLSGYWCGGHLESPLSENCGVDHAHIDWIWQPYRDGIALDEITAEIAERDDDPNFPLTAFSYEPGLPECDTPTGCLYGYRGPLATTMVIWPGIVESEEWPGYQMFGWWTSLEIRGGFPTLYIDTAQIAG